MANFDAVFNLNPNYNTSNTSNNSIPNNTTTNLNINTIANYDDDDRNKRKRERELDGLLVCKELERTSCCLLTVFVDEGRISS